MRQQDGQRTISRRALTWAVPAVAIAAPAPAFAASPVACPVIPDGSQWTATTATGTLGPASTGAYGWNAGGVFVTFRDNGSSTTPLFYRSQIALNLTAGTTYTLAAPINWGYGNGVEAESTGLTIRLQLGGTVLLARSSRTSGANGLGLTPNTTTYTMPPFTPSVTGAVILQVEVEISPLTRASNDDVRLFAPSFSSCTVN